MDLPLPCKTTFRACMGFDELHWLLKGVKRDKTTCLKSHLSSLAAMYIRVGILQRIKRVKFDYFPKSSLSAFLAALGVRPNSSEKHVEK